MHHLEIEGVSKLIHVTLTCRQISLSYIHSNISIDTFKRFNGDVCVPWRRQAFGRRESRCIVQQ